MVDMLTEEHRKEGLSRAYVQAVGAQAGVIVDIGGRSQDYGIDGSFHGVRSFEGQRTENGVSIDFQLKATSCLEVHDDFVALSLDVRTINMLAARANVRRAILIVLSIPPHPDEWVQISEQELLLRRCCYWSHISSPTNNLYTATHKIPRAQLFTAEVLRALLISPQTGVLV